MPSPRWEQNQPREQSAAESRDPKHEFHISQTPQLQLLPPQNPQGQRCPQSPGAVGAAAGRYSINHGWPGSDNSGFYLPVFGRSVRNDLQMLFTAFGLAVN